LIANQNALTQVVIPTPDASKLFSEYDLFYDTHYTLPKSLIRFSAQIEESIGVAYNLDEKDDLFLNSIRSSEISINDDEFEKVISAFELTASEKPNNEIPTLTECCAKLESLQSESIFRDSNAMDLIYNHWKTKRFELNSGKPIQPTLKVIFLHFLYILIV
jgi:ADP-heptose:LPS heptosyltransferase